MLVYICNGVTVMLYNIIINNMLVCSFSLICGQHTIVSGHKPKIRSTTLYCLLDLYWNCVMFQAPVVTVKLIVGNKYF